MERMRKTVKTKRNTHQGLKPCAATSGKRGFAAEPQNVPKRKERIHVKSIEASLRIFRKQEGQTREAGFTVRENLRRNMVTLQVWADGADPASSIPLKRLPATISGGSAEAKWSYRLVDADVPPESDPGFMFTAHSAWCAYKASGKCTVKLKRPQITKTEWKDKDGGATGKGLVGEELTLSATCNSDTEDGCGVTFKVYKEGESPGSAAPVAQLGATVEGGKAEAKWVYHYKHDSDNPLKAKPKYFFTADTQRAKQVKSGTVEIGAILEFKVVPILRNKLVKCDSKLLMPDGKEESINFDTEYVYNKKDVIPGIYTIKGVKNNG